jgi:hypothetical protein
MKVSTENDNNFGYEKITIVVDNIPLSDILTILGIIWACKVFLDCFFKRNNLTPVEKNIC